MPNPRFNFLDPRTIFYSLVVGGAVGAAFGSSVVGLLAWIVVYVLAALSPWNHTTCPACGTSVNPRASVCRACGQSLEPS